MRKYLLLSVVLLFAAGVSGQDGNSPAYKTLKAFSKWYAIDAPDSIYGLFGDELKRALPAENWRQLFPRIKGSLGVIGEFVPEGSSALYHSFLAIGSTDSTGLVLSLDSSNRIQGLHPKPKAAAASVYHTNYKVSTADGDLAGELLAPPHMGHKVPVVLIIAGSGPTDRNGNNMLGVRAAPYKLLAEELEKNGIASLRYDKRFIGESVPFRGRLDSLRFEDMLGDARACIRKLKADTGFSAVVVVGHSEGALLGSIAAREEKADRFISLSGVGEDATAVLKRQLAVSLPPQSLSMVNSWLDSLHKGHRVTVPASAPAANLFAPTSQTYLMSWFKYDPSREIARLDIPVLIIQGLTDLQVGRQDAEKLKAAAPKASLVLIDSMNHVLKDAPMDRARNIATYADEKLPLDKELVRTIIEFIKATSDSPAFR